MLFLFLFSLLFSFLPLVLSKSYDTTLEELTGGFISSETTEGEFLYNVPEVKQIIKRDGTPITELHELLAKLPELNVHSYDNALTLQSLGNFATMAYRDGKYGDFFYLWQVMNHNGLSAQINDLSNGELQYELLRLFGDVPNIAKDLEKTLTSEKVAEMYKSIGKTGVKKSVVKRDYTGCHEENVPQKKDCEKLMDSLTHGWMNSRNMLRCKGTCCASWSKVLNVHAIYIESKVGWCHHKCILYDRSCKIYGMDFDDKHFNFCTASTVGCSD